MDVVGKTYNSGITILSIDISCFDLQVQWCPEFVWNKQGQCLNFTSMTGQRLQGKKQHDNLIVGERINCSMSIHFGTECFSMSLAPW